MPSNTRPLIRKPLVRLADVRVMRHVPTVPFRHSAREPRPNRSRVAFVLSGGGNQAVAQVGMLRALIEREITPDVVIGTSAGALNAVAVAASPTLAGVAQLANVWGELSGGEVFPGGRLSRAWNVVRRGTYLFDSAGLDGLIDRATRARTFDDLAVPLRVIATDLDSGEEVVLASGPLKPALLASTALPGVFPIVAHDGRRLVDGGVVDAVPLWHALSSAVDVVYVMNVSSTGHDRPLRSPLDVVMTSFAHSRNLRFELELRHAPPEVEIVVLPRPRDVRDLFDFSGSETLIDEAHRLACAVLDDREPVVPDRARVFRRFRSA
ncbi:MAG: patatin-like phospholipase [Actinomycetia bacterium]|nr:patatin-like phospholipase [Actinomycetes bacterium]